MLVGADPPVEPPPSRYALPDAASAGPGNELVALGADLEPGTLLAAYRSGLFPMPVDPRKKGGRIAWYSPDPRGILPLDNLHVSHSLKSSLRRFEVTVDTDVAGVIERCADDARPGRWITAEFRQAYERLAELGWAHSVEVHRDGALVGGLYGVMIDRFFAGESMFHEATDASKVALVHLVELLRDAGVTLLDTQWLTDHLASLGAIEVPRRQYLRMLAEAID